VKKFLLVITALLALSPIHGGAGGGFSLLAAFAAPESLCADSYSCHCVGATPNGVYDQFHTSPSSIGTCSGLCKSISDAQAATSMNYTFQCKNAQGMLFVPDGGSGSAQSYGEQAINAIPGSTPVIPILNVPIPGLNLEGSVTNANGMVSSNLLGLYVQAAYRFLLVAGSIMAVVMLMVGGLQYVTSGGSSKRVEKAKERIRNAIIGLVLLFAAFDLAFLLDPATVMFKPLIVESVPQIANDIRADYMLAESQISGGASVSQTDIERFKAMSKPSQTELENGVQFFITSYYAPAYGDTQGDLSFECNIAMQCSCPDSPVSGRKNAPQEAKTCYSKGLNYYWEPCTPFPSTTPFCNKTTAFKEGLVTTPPVGRRTAAVDRSVLPLGTVFKVFGAPDAASNSAIWYAEDTGGEIKGRRVDLFMGSGKSALDVAKRNIGEVTIRVCPNNDPAKCPTTLN
jgi:3D (Asp-Asp-Asp) domain-containing protein